MAGFYKKKQYEDIKVKPVDCKKIVVKTLWYFYRFDSRCFKKYQEIWMHYNILYQSGAGSHHATGFGSLNVIRQGKMNERWKWFV